MILINGNNSMMLQHVFRQLVSIQEYLAMGNERTKQKTLTESPLKNKIEFYFISKNNTYVASCTLLVCVFISCFNKPLMVSFRCFSLNLHCVDTRSFIEMSGGHEVSHSFLIGSAFGQLKFVNLLC